MKWFIFAVLSMHVYLSKGQNLIPNPSFEDYIQCPNKLNQLFVVEKWYNFLNSSVEYYHMCSAMGSDVSIPKNIGGFQFSKADSAYVGLALFSKNINNAREYLGVQLSDELIKNKSYNLTLFVSLADTSQYAISNLGVYFSKTKPTTDCNLMNSVMDCLTPQIINSSNTYLDDTLNWQKFTGTFIAQGGEKHILIGNFYLDRDVNYYLCNNLTNFAHAYYYIDKVSLIKVPNQDISVVKLMQPECYSENSTLQLRIQNSGLEPLDFTVDSFTFKTEVFLNGKYFQTVSTELSDNQSNSLPGLPLEPEASMNIGIGPIDLSNYDSTYSIQVSSFSKRDSNSTNDSVWTMFIPSYSPACFSLIIPNVFSPNGDGINDVFYFHQAEDKELSTQIFNRWGKEVSSWKGNTGWDGHNLPAGVYFYLVREKIDETEKVYKGKVTLLR